MRQVILSILLSLSILTLFSGCGCKQSELEAYRVANPYYIEVSVPVMCKIAKPVCKSNVDVSRNQYLINSLECVVDYSATIDIHNKDAKDCNEF
jgi:ABC-type Zn uptake system ZnuABC Zn-binding protein ZnuA